MRSSLDSTISPSVLLAIDYAVAVEPVDFALKGIVDLPARDGKVAVTKLGRGRWCLRSVMSFS